MIKIRPNTYRYKFIVFNYHSILVRLEVSHEQILFESSHTCFHQFIHCESLCYTSDNFVCVLDYFLAADQRGICILYLFPFDPVLLLLNGEIL